MSKKAKEVAIHDKDTGSSEVQIALLTEKIEDINYLCVGINHMAFYQKFEKKSNGGPGEDLYPRLKIIADKIVNDEKLSSRSEKING